MRLAVPSNVRERKSPLRNSINSPRTKAILIGWLFVLMFSINAAAQKPTAGKPAASAQTLPKVTLVDEASVKPFITAKGRPLLINFWATWCDPCREEFPDLVKLDQEFKGKIDFITISLDDPADIATTVPKFLSSMKAEMPAYLLRTPDESAFIAAIAKNWQGAMPFTILYDKDGKAAYQREGKVVLDVIRPQITALLSNEKVN
jgi:thiol-disulfide isomerase/thioredoxin